MSDASAGTFLRILKGFQLEVSVKKGQEDAFLQVRASNQVLKTSLLEASLQNARASKGEDTNQRFDVLQMRRSPVVRLEFGSPKLSTQLLAVDNEVFDWKLAM